MPTLMLDDEEQAALDALRSVVDTITKTWGMTENEVPLLTAAHVIKSNIIQHMLHRLAPDAWDSWTPREVDDYLASAV
jgi:hypothetical protein